MNEADILDELIEIKNALKGIEEVLLVIAGLKTKDEYIDDMS